ncbi:MAG: hypothetical protein QW625_03845 [Candidatus Nanoarchaeia archaeon]
MIILIGFTSPLFATKIFDESLGQRETIMSNLIINLFSGKISLSTSYEILLTSMIILYILTALLFLLNGLGKIYNRYSVYASFLTFVYLFLGLITVSIINNQTSLSLFGISFTSVVTDFGVYSVAIIGFLYLVFRKYINSKIRI